MFFLNSGLLDFPWWGVVAATLIMTHITIVAVTVYLHRSQAHRALVLKMKNIVARGAAREGGGVVSRRFCFLIVSCMFEPLCFGSQGVHYRA